MRVALALVLLAGTVVQAQSLGDLARQEAARRQTLSQAAPLVTNADLTVRPAPVPPDLPAFPVIRPAEHPATLVVVAPAAPAVTAPAWPFLFLPRSPTHAHGDPRPRALEPTHRPDPPSLASPFRNPLVDALFGR